MPSRWLLLFLVIALLLILSCSQGTSPFYPPVHDASLFFNLSGTPKYIWNGGNGTAYEVHLYRFVGTSYVENFANRDSIVSREQFPLTVSTYDSLVATWKNPNGTPGRVKGPENPRGQNVEARPTSRAFSLACFLNLDRAADYVLQFLSPREGVPSKKDHGLIIVRRAER